VVALQHAGLGDVGETEDAVRRGVVELSRLEQARSIADTISPPGSAFTAAPMAVNMSMEIPTVRYFMPRSPPPWLSAS
jgi:hypothetical protein